MAAETTTVHAVSVDSSARQIGDPDNDYIVDFGRDIQRVKSIQLASIQFPDCRYALGSQAQMSYVEPLTIAPDTYLVIEETTAVLNKTSGQTTTTTNQVSWVIPPTINEVTGYNAGTVSLTHESGLDFANLYYPRVNLRVKLAGGHYPQTLMTVPMPAPFPTESGPILNADTTTSVASFDYDYAAGYLAALNTGGNDATRHYLAANYTSYVYADKPLPVELFTMLNAAMGDAQSAANVTGAVVSVANTTPIQISTTPTAHTLHTHDQVTITGTSVAAANGTFIITVIDDTTFSLNGTVASGVGVGGTWASVRKLDTNVSFGFDDRNNSFLVQAPTMVRDTRTTRTTISTRLLNFGLGTLLNLPTSRLDPPARPSFPTTLVRQLDLQPGNFTEDEMAAMIEDRMNPLVFLDSDLDNRTLRIIMPSASIFPVWISRGRYTATQMVDFLNFYLQPGPADVTVSYNATTGKFTFAHDLGLTFGLQFSGDNNSATAAEFGFENVDYVGSNTYTSVKRAVFGVPSGAAFPLNNYAITTNATQRHFNFTADEPLLYLSDNGTNTANVSAVWDLKYECVATTAGAAQSFQPGDIVFVSRPFYSDTITGATNASPIQVTTTGAHGLTTGNNVTISCVEGNTAANGTWYITVTGGTTFTLDGSTGNGAYTTGGIMRSNTSGVTDVPTNVYTAIVQSAWDASSGVGTAITITLEPTPSIFSALDAANNNRATGVPNGPNDLVQMWGAHRNVFQLIFSDPNASNGALGFPSVAWPPSVHALQNPQEVCMYPGYDATINAVPVATTYTSPYCWCLDPPPYMLMVIHAVPTGGGIHTHVYGSPSESRPIFAKLMITSPYMHISEEMLFFNFANYEKIGRVGVQFQNPDGTLVEFNGKPHTYTLLFTSYLETATGECF